MILGTWNLEVYPSLHASKGKAMRDVLRAHRADIWFLTELHANFTLDGYHTSYSASRDKAPVHQRKTAITSRLPMTALESRSHPAEGRICLGRLLDTCTEETLLAASTALPCRSKAPYFRTLFGDHLSYAEICQYMLEYFADRINEERRPGEALIWGGD